MTKTISLIAALGLALVACKDDSPKLAADASPPQPDAPSAPKFAQVEQLARPGINEALLRSQAFLNGYNATAPSFAGVDMATLAAVVGEAKGTLKAIYLGVCLTDGLAGLTASTGLKPAGMQCADVGAAVFQENTASGVTISSTSATAAQAYADQVFSQFEPDVMRIDTTKASGYLTLCGNASTAPLLCGGRNLTDDVIDITYDYLLAGAAINGASPAQFKALVSDGVVYDNSSVTASNPTSLSTPDPTNSQQGHPATTATFPFSAPPI